MLIRLRKPRFRRMRLTWRFSHFLFPNSRKASATSGYLRTKRGDRSGAYSGFCRKASKTVQNSLSALAFLLRPHKHNTSFVPYRHTWRRRRGYRVICNSDRDERVFDCFVISEHTPIKSDNPSRLLARSSWLYQNMSCPMLHPSYGRSVLPAHRGLSRYQETNGKPVESTSR